MPKKFPEIKNTIRQYLQAGFSIHAQWDAGGDECLCNVWITDPKQKQIENSEVCNKLHHLVVDELDLPSAGEVFHNGGGSIEINEKNQVFIRFSAKYGYYADDYYWDEEDETMLENESKGDISEIIVKQIVEDSLGLRRHLHRADISLIGKINREGQADTDIFIQIRQGDELKMSELDKKPYQSILESLLSQGLETMMKQEAPLLKKPKDTLFGSVQIKGKLRQAAEVEFKLSPSGEHFENFVNKEVVLID
jgi:hypothetical protein